MPTSHPTTGPGRPETEETVLTPGGWRPKSKVHFIEHGHHLSGKGGRLKEIETSTLKVIRDFGSIPKSKKGKANFARSIAVPASKRVSLFANPAALGSGWITYAGWTNNTGSPIESFTTEWVVPPAPSTQSGQTIFLFNGIQNSAFILQPVLQWGVSAAGGGNYWAVANWYVDGPGGDAKYSPLIQVNEGDDLVGVMTLTDQNGGLFSYNSDFTNVPGTNLNVLDIEELTWANETLEAYGIANCSDYPNTPYTSMISIQIQAGGNVVAPVWQPETPVSDCGQRTVINGTTIDLYYS